MTAEAHGATGDTEVVSRVRASVVEELRRLDRSELSDDTVLVASELATNAVLHAGGIADVRISATDAGVRIEVHDRTRVPPLLARQSVEAMTGRGLRLVAALSARWAAEPTPDGKMVWAELSRESSHSPGSAQELLDFWDDEAWDFGEPARVRHRVSLGEVPTALLLAAKAHVDNLVREFTLAARGADSGVTDELPRHLALLVETVVNRFSEARQEIKRQAVMAANQGLRHVQLELTLPAEAAGAGEEYLAALDEADAYCRAARLLTLETPPQHRVFRQWYVGELISQLRAAAAGVPAPTPQSFVERLLEEIDRAAKAQKASERGARLYTVAAALSRAATHEEVAAAVLEQGVAALGASGGGMLLATEADRLVVPGTVGYDEEVVARLRAESQDAELPAAVALRTGEPVWLESREERDRRFPELTSLERGTVSVCAVPLVVGGRRLGALGFSFPQPRLFDEDERRFVLALAAQTSQALHRAQLHDRQLDFSRRLQLSLLPRRLEALPGIEIAAVYHSLGDGAELGGDIYDAWPIGEGCCGLAIADATGTGPEAAALSAMVRFTVRALTVPEVDPAWVLERLNHSLLASDVSGSEGERFCTAVLGVLATGPTPTVALAAGGHPSPIVRRADGRIEEVVIGGGLLGAFDDIPVAVRTMSLNRGDTLVLYTDGAIEARRGSVMFGTEGLARVIATAPQGATEVAQAIERSVLQHSGGVVSDDLAALVVHITGD